MKTQTVTVQTHDGPMDVFIVFPKDSSKKPHPALIVLQEAFGVNGHIKHICEKLAADGYVAAAPELFHRGGKGIEIPYTDFMTKGLPLMGQLTNDRLTDDMSATLNYLQTLSEVEKNKIGTIGFCMGGFCALLAACRLPVNAAVSFYGGGINKERPGIGFSPILGEFPRIQCPVFLGYAENDHGITKEDVEVTRDAMTAAEKKFDLHIYANAQHAFLCDERPSYQPDAARAAWADTLKWLSSAL